MKIPKWSVLIIVPVIIVGASLPAIGRSERPVSLTLVAFSASIVVALMAWGVLQLLDRMRR
jgi:hypothetical protein